MTFTPLRRFLATILLLSATLLGRAESTPKISDLGNNTYSVTVAASHKFTRNTDKLKVAAVEAASAYCTKQDRHLKIVDVVEKKSFYGVGDMANVTLTFKALAAGDPELAVAPAPAVSAKLVGTAAATPPMSLAPAPLTNEALYTDLLRLDDLRKKGILTDEEFAAEKKKLLDRSK
jgi:hypothetical protein